MQKQNLNLLEKGLEELGIIVSPRMMEQFVKYYELLIEWNEKMNLTAITDESEVVIKHFLDSILITKVVELDKIHTLIDIGTGAGFPGIPLQICFPDKKVTLMDSLNKRIQFLEVVKTELGLTSCTCVHARAEDLARDPKHREKYELVVSRAVSNLATLSEYCVPFTKINGLFVAYKSADYEKELEESKKAIHLLGGTNVLVKKTMIPGSDITRTYVLVSKMQSTPKIYPRKAGTPAKKPL